MKINSNTRIRVKRTIHQEFNVSWWDLRSIKIKMREDYGMIFTSDRNFSYYFRPTDKQKYMLFILSYASFIMDKSKKYH